MITEIAISNVAIFPTEPVTFPDLRQINLVFGPNGSGKSTLGRIINSEDRYPSCSITWENGQREEVLTYSKDFVRDNFDEVPHLNGVFTLGAENVALLGEIAATKQSIDRTQLRIQGLTSTLRGEDGQGGKLRELNDAEDDFKERCWRFKVAHQELFGLAFTGHIGSKDRFRDKILTEWASEAELIAIDELEDLARALFQGVPSREDLISPLVFSSLVACENQPILRKRVIGKEDVDIAGLIRRLNNSDWVRAGLAYLPQADGLCPFCQQNAPAELNGMLEEYFDESFARDSEAIVALHNSYERESEVAVSMMEALLQRAPRGLDLNELQVLFERLKAALQSNFAHLTRKRGEPSEAVELETITHLAAAISGLVERSNTAIRTHNGRIDNLAEERAALASRIWKWIVDSLAEDGEIRRRKTYAASRAIEALTAKLLEMDGELASKRQALRQLEQQVTSIQPTIDNINGLLRGYGFSSFAIGTSDQGPFYQLTRANGTSAKETLSEGERTFVSFLYFYFLLKGSREATGVVSNRVVVFDDPISSLDSDILFIVASLIRSFFRDAAAGEGPLKQIFVLTHNILFHKELSYMRAGMSIAGVKFWTLRKVDGRPIATPHETNPVSSAYELLWQEVRDPNRSKLSIQNTLRRILESYFTLLGGLDFDEICEKFEGHERVICRTLFSWIHDGSHHAHESLYITLDDAAIEQNLRVFRLVFEKLDQLPHYKMMMRER